MLFLLVLLNDLSTYFAFSRISVALYCMRRDIGRLNNDLTVRTEHRLVVLIITLYL